MVDQKSCIFIVSPVAQLSKTNEIRTSIANILLTCRNVSFRIAIYTDLYTLTPNKIYAVLSYFIWYQFHQQAVLHTKRFRMLNETPEQSEPRRESRAKCEHCKTKQLTHRTNKYDKRVSSGIACRRRYVCKLMYFHVVLAFSRF